MFPSAKQVHRFFNKSKSPPRLEFNHKREFTVRFKRLEVSGRYLPILLEAYFRDPFRIA